MSRVVGMQSVDLLLPPNLYIAFVKLLHSTFQDCVFSTKKLSHAVREQNQKVAKILVRRCGDQPLTACVRSTGLGDVKRTKGSVCR